ncbi:MAG: redoxin family protein [Rhodomicrobium sp.]
MAPAFNLIPAVTFQIMEGGRPAALTSQALFSGRRVALFGLAGAFIPTCHHLHLPGIIDEYESIKAGGIDLVACTAVNDVFVMDAWRSALHAPPGMLFLADGNGDFVRGLGLGFDGRPFGLGERSKRYAMWVINGAIQQLAVEPDMTEADVSTAYTLLGMFESWSEGVA